jgi:hypothetical protein
VHFSFSVERVLLLISAVTRANTASLLSKWFLMNAPDSQCGQEEGTERDKFFVTAGKLALLMCR